MKKLFDTLIVLCIVSLVACGGGGGGTGGGITPGGGGNPTPVPTLAPDSIGIALPDGTIGTVNTAPYGVVGGYTQTTYSQTLAFPVGTTITLRNLSSSTPHTLNVLSTSSFPGSPALSTGAAGGSVMASGYQSGSIPAGGSVQVTLSNAGTYYIGCAYHYMDAVSMRDVLIVGSATPGPQATPAPSSGGGGCSGIYC